MPTETWGARLDAGKVTDESGVSITRDTPYLAHAKLFYFREVEDEAEVPLVESIVYEDEEILVACKPHFLPVVPAGRWVENCLLNRLRARRPGENLAPMHRIDRMTAGLVLFSKRVENRGAYHALFSERRARKTYLARAMLKGPQNLRRWTVKNRLVAGDPWFRMKSVSAASPNAHSEIELVREEAGIGWFRLHPITGKKHQLRVHMADLGFPILYDRCYPELLPEAEDDLQHPLQLVAQKLSFVDPITRLTHSFESKQVIAEV